MTKAEVATLPPWLPRVTCVHSERLLLEEPFVDVARRFAGLAGTVALLSGGDLDCARYHLLGVYPWLTLSARRTSTTLTSADQSLELAGDPFTILRQVLSHCRLAETRAQLPLSSGLLGYLAYDLKDCLEQLPRTSVDDLELPLMQLAAPGVLVIHDRLTDETTLLAMALDGDDDARLERAAQFKRALRASQERERPPPPPPFAALTSGLSRAKYCAAVDAIRKYILDGDAYQVNVARRFETPCASDPFDCFAEMYALNPAPFFAYINAGAHQIVSSSPERFIEVRGGSIETRPIKGTRPRGKTAEQDAALRSELEQSAKEDAELSMIVDLLRNDLGKVCRPGSVRVVEHKRLEAYQNVYHLVSIVRGELDPGQDAVAVLRATFPGGSITGCPKIRAMEIIDELEPVRRHIYTGSIGYIGFDGAMDLSIAIRTATFTRGKAVFSVGAGIVFDSDPASEFEETIHKGRTLMQALTRSGAAPEAERGEGTVWHDGAFTSGAAATVPMDCEGLAYGYGIFETLRVQAGRPILLDAHVERFERAWRELFRCEPPDVTWGDVIAQLIRKNALSNTTAVVKLMALVRSPAGSPPAQTLFASARPYVPRPALSLRAGMSLRVYPHRRHTPLAEHKTLNYLFYRLAGDWAKRHGADEALILNADGSVSETNTASLCCITGDTACFPTSPHALPGTMAAEVRRLLARWGLRVEDRRLSVHDLVTADQVLLTSSLMGAVPALSLDGAELRPVGGLCAKLNRAVFEGVLEQGALEHERPDGDGAPREGTSVEVGSATKAPTAPWDVDFPAPAAQSAREAVPSSS